MNNDKLYNYLKEIQEKEDLHGKLPVEKTREILIKYFSDYTFDSEEQAVNFFYSFNAIDYPYGKDKNYELAKRNGLDVLKRCAEASLSELYNFDATVDGLKLIIKNTGGNIYSWNVLDKWHEGYDPFIGDKHKCRGDTLEEAIKSLYVKDLKLNWSDITTSKKIGLITVGTGYGKTNYTENQLIDDINEANFVWSEMKEPHKYSKKDILFITTRRSILDQQKVNGLVVDAWDDDFSISGTNPAFDDRGDRVRIITTSKLGSLYQQDKIEKMFPIVVIDEIHSLFLDTMFADTSYFCVNCIYKYWDDTLKFGLTATPDLLLNYIDKNDNMFYLLDDGCLLNKYNTDEFCYCNYTYISSVVEKLEPKPEEKVMVYCNSAKTAIALAEKYNGAYLISKYNKNREAVEKQQPIYDYIIENQKLPDYINIIFMTSAYREGVEIKDPNVRYISIDACDEITISQFLGRVRNDVAKVIINTNDQQLARIENTANEYLKIKDYNQGQLGEYYANQMKNIETNGSGTMFVLKKDDGYIINQYIVPVQQYLLDCYYQANNKMENMVVRRGDKTLIDSDSWFSKFLKDYSKTPIKRIDGKQELNEEFANWNAIYHYLGKMLFDEDKEELVKEIGLYDAKHNRLYKWSKVKPMIRDMGFHIQEGRKGYKRYSIITVG